MTASTRTGRRLGWSPAGRLLAVLTLALAVIGMHSMGAGHLDLMADSPHGIATRRSSRSPPPCTRTWAPTWHQAARATA